MQTQVFYLIELFHFQQKELMEAGRKQLEQLVQMNFLQHQAQQHLSQHPEIGKTLLEQMSQENFNNSNQSQNVINQFLTFYRLLKVH